MKLLNIDANAKTVKGQGRGYMTAILYLAPADESGYEVCPMASKGCRKACLNKAGMGAFSNVQAARIAKTKWYFEDRSAFMAQLVAEVRAFIRKAIKLGLIPVVRHSVGACACRGSGQHHGIVSVGAVLRLYQAVQSP
jgi:hypothetical protein